MLFDNIYNQRRVFLTGHTGFKGSWLTAWLSRLGAVVCGFSNGYVSEPDHFSQMNFEDPILDSVGDIRDDSLLQSSMSDFQPEIVFHLAAQPLVRRSYVDPLETFSTNIQGTVNLLQACRNVDSVRAVVVVTTDKVYENREWDWGYRENDPLGGHDPYAASKACAEIVVNSFRKSFFDSNEKLLATCRAGNVIGGGDWAENRLIPDLIRAAACGEKTWIRMPGAIRPWQHVLEPLAGYLLIGQKLLEGNTKCADAWNFGPDPEGAVSVGDVVRMTTKYWNKLQVEIVPNSSWHETSNLMLDCSKAKKQLCWKPVWSLEESIAQTIIWYKHFYETGEILTWGQLDRFIGGANCQCAIWTNSGKQPFKRVG